MAPRNKIDFIYIHFSYVQEKKSNIFESLSTHKEPKMSDFLITQRDWATHILTTEISKLPPTTKLRFTEWRFMTSAADYFKIHDQLYDKILLILGEEAVYWTFYMHTPYGRRIQGKAQLPLTYCACCIKEQYQQILEAVKDHIQKSMNIK